MRPLVLLEDTQGAPARAGVSTIAMAMLLLATALLPFGQIALVVWWVAGLSIASLAIAMLVNCKRNVRPVPISA